MTNKEIFNKTIKKAKNQGYKPLFLPIYSYIDSYAGEMIIYETYIFSHEFAKAFWGEEEWREPLPNADGYKLAFTNKGTMKNWQYHLHLMVLEEEPLKYLEKFL